jgi:hypothetical protein
MTSLALLAVQPPDRSLSVPFVLPLMALPLMAFPLIAVRSFFALIATFRSVTSQ